MGAVFGESAAAGMRVACAAVTVAALTLLASCGGATNSNGPDTPTIYAAQSCSPNNPFRGDATAPTSVGSLTIEKNWLRNYIDNSYLWFDEVPNVNPSARDYSNENDVFGSLNNYFNDLLTPVRTASNTLKDQFSFIYPTAAWDALINSGSSLGHGIEWQNPESDTPRVAYVHAGSPASMAGVLRGDTLVQIDNTPLDAMTAEEQLVVLFPGAPGAHAFRFSRGGVALKATAADQGAAYSVGIDVPRVFSIAWILACATAAGAGVLVGAIGGISPTMGVFGLSVLVVVIIGGLDSIAGALVGGLLIGLVEALAGAFLGGEFKLVVTFALLLVLLMVRPYGLFGTHEIERL